MICAYCGYDADNYNICPGCKRDLTVYKRIRLASDLCYNEGLRKANVRDLSGAIDELTKSLKYDKNNIDARNLLGLIYFEIGEPVNAMAEWVISKNLMPENNLADGYLNELQKNRNMLSRMDEATMKYNQALACVEREEFDLAKIQLKSLVSKNPGMIRARSLLALLYLQDSEGKAATRELRQAAKVDVGNPTINTYLQEVKYLSKDETKKDSLSSIDSPTVSYLMDYSKVSIVNIIIGIIVGVLVSLFLIFPAIKQNNNEDARLALINANEEKRSNQNDVEALEQTIEVLQEKLEEYEGSSNIKMSYENLFNTLNAINEEDLEKASEYYALISRDILDEAGKNVYDSLSETVGNYALTSGYENANALMEQEEYEVAIIEYKKLIDSTETYDDGNAMYNLAICYTRTDNNEKALEYFNRVIELFPDSEIASKASDEIENMTR